MPSESEASLFEAEYAQLCVRWFRANLPIAIGLYLAYTVWDFWHCNMPRGGRCSFSLDRPRDTNCLWLDTLGNSFGNGLLEGACILDR